MDAAGACESEALSAIEAARGVASTELDDARVRYLGRKSELKQALREVRDRETGMALNAVRERLEAAVEAREHDARARRARGASTPSARSTSRCPATPVRRGRLHLLTQIRREIEDIFLGLGYEVYDGDEVATVWRQLRRARRPTAATRRARRATRSTSTTTRSCARTPRPTRSA